MFCNIYRQQERSTPNDIVIYAKQTPTSAVKVSGLVRVRVTFVLAQSTSVSFLSHLLTSWTGPPDPIFVIHPYASTLLSNIVKIAHYLSDLKISPQLFQFYSLDILLLLLLQVLRFDSIAQPVWFREFEWHLTVNHQQSCLRLEPWMEKEICPGQGKHHLLYHQYSQVSLVLVVLHASLRYLFHRLYFKRSLQVMVCFALFIFPTRFFSTHTACCISAFPPTINMIKFCER